MKNSVPPELDFHERLSALRKERGLTQHALADLVEMHIFQIRRYESGQSQPALDAMRKLSRALSVSADMLLFAKDERVPDDDLRLQFEAASRLDQEEKRKGPRSRGANRPGTRGDSGGDRLRFARVSQKRTGREGAAPNLREHTGGGAPERVRCARVPRKSVIRSVIESIVLRNTVKAAERRFTTADTGAASR